MAFGTLIGNSTRCSQTIRSAAAVLARDVATNENNTTDASSVPPVAADNNGNYNNEHRALISTASMSATAAAAASLVGSDDDLNRTNDVSILMSGLNSSDCSSGVNSNNNAAAGVAPRPSSIRITENPIPETASAC